MIAVPRLLAVSDAASTPIDWDGWCAALGEVGVPALWVREKTLSDLERWRLAARARRALPPPRVVLVSGRVDLARAAGADGVQLAADGLPVAAARAAAGGAPALVGRSTHSPAEVERAAAEGADFVLFGPVFEVPGKTGPRPPLGVSSLADAARLGVPVLAIGGVDDASRLERVLAAGARGAAGIRGFRNPVSAAALVAALAQAIDPDRDPT